MVYYKSSEMKVCINGKYSRTFKTTEGFKQGDPMSSDLFNCYQDELTDIIENLNIGIALSLIKVDIVQYADDITLIATTANGLQKQITSCEEYGEKYGMRFNPDKTLVIIFNLGTTRSIEKIVSDQ